MSRKVKMSKQKLICPVCKTPFSMFDMRYHWQDSRDDKHRKLDTEIELACNDAYNDEEIRFVLDHCEVYVGQKKKKG